MRPAAAAALLALLCGGALLALLFGGSSNEEPPPLLPPLDERDVDTYTSEAALLRHLTCPQLAQLQLRWLPNAPARATPTLGGAPLIPFLLLHELHVGEAWLVRMLRALGAHVEVAQETGAEAHKHVRESAHRWLESITKPARRGRAPNATLAGAAAVGLAISPQALRTLNHGIRMPSGSGRTGLALPLRLITLTRRNRLKHAVSCHARQLHRHRGGLRLGDAGALTMPIDELTKQLEVGGSAHAALECSAREVVGRLAAAAASSSGGGGGGGGGGSSSSSSNSNSNSSSQLGVRKNASIGQDVPSLDAVVSSEPRLALHYEDLLYDTARTLARMRAFLGLHVPSSGGAVPGALPLPPVAKRAPNSLCVRLRNWPALCEAVQGTVWAADLQRTTSAAAEDAAGGGGGAGGSVLGAVMDTRRRGAAWRAEVPSGACALCEVGQAGLVLGGSHHKTGTVLLERLLAMYAAKSRVHFYKPSWEQCPALARREAGVCVDEHLALSKLRRYWDDPQGAPTALLAPLVHIVREPLETCISAYQYHLVSTEAWLRTPRPEDLVRRGPTAGLPWQAVLRQADTRTGLRLECRRSIHDQIVQQAEVFNATRRHVRVFTLRMEATERDFDGSTHALFRFLTVAHERWLDTRRSPSSSENRSAGGGGRGGSTVHGARLGGSSRQDEERIEALTKDASKFDLSRHRRELDDGHLSAVQRKRLLRGMLLNESKLAAELAHWRVAAGYDHSYRVHCERYGLSYFEEALADGIRVGPSLWDVARRRRRSRRRLKEHSPARNQLPWKTHDKTPKLAKTQKL